MAIYIILDTFGNTVKVYYSSPGFDRAVAKLQQAGLRVSVGHNSARVLGEGALLITEVLKK